MRIRVERTVKLDGLEKRRRCQYKEQRADRLIPDHARRAHHLWNYVLGKSFGVVDIGRPRDFDSFGELHFFFMLSTSAG
jgi:hypothetical protein